jgi:hypothetical protein
MDVTEAKGGTRSAGLTKLFWYLCSKSELSISFKSGKELFKLSKNTVWDSTPPTSTTTDFKFTLLLKKFLLFLAKLNTTQVKRIILPIFSKAGFFA